MLDFNQRRTEILGETGSKKSKNEKTQLIYTQTEWGWGVSPMVAHKGHAAN